MKFKLEKAEDDDYEGLEILMRDSGESEERIKEVIAEIKNCECGNCNKQKSLSHQPI